MPKTAKQKAQPQAAVEPSNLPVRWANMYPQTAGTSSVGGYYFGNSTVTPNIQWQGTTSGATYTAARRVLTT